MVMVEVQGVSGEAGGGGFFENGQNGSGNSSSIVGVVRVGPMECLEVY